MTSPADVAVSDGYIAIADGTTLFVFDRDRNTWQEYTHTDTVTKLQFGSRDELYFLDSQMHLHLFNVKTFATPISTGVVCNTFSIHGNNAYYVNISAGMASSIYRAPLRALTEKEELHTANLLYASAISYWNSEVYYTDTAGNLHKLTPAGTSYVVSRNLPLGVISMTISEGVLCCATQTGGFYAYNILELSESPNDCQPIASYEGNYSDVATNGNDVYLVAGDKIEKFSLIDKKFSPYSISAASNAPHRFDGASEMTLAGNKLFISDDNNDRISVYDTVTNTFKTSISCELDSPFVTSDGENLLVATSSQAILYSLEESTYGQAIFTLPTDKISGNVVGATAVYGSYYLVTDTNYCYLLTKGEEGYSYTETLRNAHFAEMLTSDVNGALYLLNNGSVYRYTEENFLTQAEEGIKICEGVPADTKKLSVDYGGNLYALTDTTLYKYVPQPQGLYTLYSATAFDKELVYGASNEVSSFAFGIEENKAYILYKDNYLTVTDGLALPTVKTIATGDVAQGIYGDTANFTVVQTLPNSFIVQVDGEKLQEAATFPYLCSYRSEQPITALKIGETGNYALLTYRENASSAYKTILVEKNRQVELNDDYKITYETQKTGYLTNLSKTYKFPSVGLPTLGEIEKNAQVAIVGELNGLDCEYYTVAYGETTAYIPKSHVLFFDGTPPTTETVNVGDTSSTENEMWRLAYLLLGSAAICVLVDVLILRKKPEDDE